MTTLSPMNPEHLNDTDTGIDALMREGLATALNLLSGHALLRDRPPGL